MADKDKIGDPLALWQTMLGEMEKGMNSIANQAMASPEFSKAMNQAGGVGATAQKQLGELMEKYLGGINMPTRAQMVGIAERLQSIENQLSEIKSTLSAIQKQAGLQPSDAASAPPKPPRTRRPPADPAPTA